MPNYAHLDGTGRVVNVVVIDHDLAADHNHLIHLPDGSEVGVNWFTDDGGETWHDHRMLHPSPSRSVPFHERIEGSVDAV